MVRQLYACTDIYSLGEKLFRNSQFTVCLHNDFIAYTGKVHDIQIGATTITQRTVHKLRYT